MENKNYIGVFINLVGNISELLVAEMANNGSGKLQFRNNICFDSLGVLVPETKDFEYLKGEFTNSEHYFISDFDRVKRLEVKFYREFKEEIALLKEQHAGVRFIIQSGVIKYVV